ncbi:MAG TPA: T9SS type A sorting domain-containing protein, partial [Chitinophagales bacterium]
YGKNALSQCDIAYWVKGGNKCYYQWHGYLTTFQTADVTLPPFDWTGLDSTDRVFYAEVSYPSNTTDDFEPNNLLSSNFNLPPVMDSSFIIYLKTNNHADENGYVLHTEQGDSLIYRSGMSNTTIYRDTTHLENGSYAFDLYDYDVDDFWDDSGLQGDGISYWLNTQGGYESAGQFFFKKLNNTNVIIYNNRYGSGNNGDFGNNLHYEFTVGAPLGYGDPKAPCTPIDHTTGIKEIEQMNLAVYPNPANENFFVKVDQSIGNSTATIFNLQGQKVFEQTIYLVNGQAAEIALPASVSTGMYVVEIHNGKNSFNRKLSVIRK